MSADQRWPWLDPRDIGVIGRIIALQVVSDEDVRQNLRPFGLPERAVEGMVGMTSGLRENFPAEQPRSLVTTTPTTLAAWAYVHLRPLLAD